MIVCVTLAEIITKNKTNKKKEEENKRGKMRSLKRREKKVELRNSRGNDENWITWHTNRSTIKTKEQIKNNNNNHNNLTVIKKYRLK